MNILVTGAKGFVGRNLVENLKNIRDGKNRAKGVSIEKIFEYDSDTDEKRLLEFCRAADFVFHLAGVNRPKETEKQARANAYMSGNYGFSSKLLDTLKGCGNSCPVLLASSIQASLIGRFAHSDYGRSKKAGEELFFSYGSALESRILVYRFPNLFGKWCKPNYNSAVATFCNAIAKDLPYQVDNRKTELELVYIDDLIAEFFLALEGKEHRCEYEGTTAVEKADGRYCFVPVTHRATLGEIVDLLQSFKAAPKTGFRPELPEGSFMKKLYSTYLSYLPPEAMAYDLIQNTDSRGIFTELMKTQSFGQVSVNIVKPGCVRGEHWHNSKWEIFVVVSGHGLIQERKIGIDPKTSDWYPIIEFEVTGEAMKAVQMLPGYTHNLINLSEEDDLVTVIWSNEPFDRNHPDTFFEKVKI